MSVIILLAVLMLTFSSCGKDDNNHSGIYFFKFKANGVQFNYNSQLLLTAHFNQSGNQHLGTISGANDAMSNISLQLYDDSPITTKSYSGFTVESGVTKGVIIGHLDPNTGLIYGSGGANVIASITISEMNTNSVKGNFSGILKNSGNSDITITDGEFFVRIP